MTTQAMIENKIVDLVYLHEALLPEELDIDRGFNSQILDQEKSE